MSAPSQARKSAVLATHRIPRRRRSARHAAAERAQSQQLVSAIYLADQATIRTLTCRVQHLERTVRTFLGARRLTTPPRHELIELRHGLRNLRTKAPRLTSGSEIRVEGCGRKVGARLWSRLDAQLPSQSIRPAPVDDRSDGEADDRHGA